MKHITRLFIALLALANLAQATEKKHLVIVKSLQKPIVTAQAKTLEQQINTLSDNGFSPYLIQTDDYPPLRQGLWAVVLGPFDAETAKAKQQRVQTWMKDAYIRAVNPPQPQMADYGFSTLQIPITDAQCFIIGESEGEGSIKLCQGYRGYRMYKFSGDYPTAFTLKPLQDKPLELPYYDGISPPALMGGAYPLTWIYRDNQLVALSGVFGSNDPNTDIFSEYRQLIHVGKQQLCPVKKQFERDDINAVLTDLNDNPSNCP